MRKGFTLLELVMVVGVLSVLLAMILPVPGMVREATKKKVAKVEATALAQAAIRYKAIYGFWPGEMVYNTPTSTRIHPDIDMSIPVGAIIVAFDALPNKPTLTYSGPPPLLLDFYKPHSNAVYQAFSTVGRPEGGGYGINPLNPKAITFLDLKCETDFDNVHFADPWGRPYCLIMGLDPKSLFRFMTTLNNSTFVVAVSNVTAFAFSAGPPTLFTTNYIYSAGVGAP